MTDLRFSQHLICNMLFHKMTFQSVAKLLKVQDKLVQDWIMGKHLPSRTVRNSVVKKLPGLPDGITTQTIEKQCFKELANKGREIHII